MSDVSWGSVQDNPNGTNEHLIQEAMAHSARVFPPAQGENLGQNFVSRSTNGKTGPIR